MTELKSYEPETTIRLYKGNVTGFEFFLTGELLLTSEELKELEYRMKIFLPKLIRRIRKKLDKQYEVGDLVVDRNGENLQITAVYEYETPVTYELRDHEYNRYWKEATADDFELRDDDE